jgi:MFS family permease
LRRAPKFSSQHVQYRVSAERSSSQALSPSSNTSFAEGRDRNRALGIWGGAGAAGLVVGVLLGGVLTRAFGWEAVFFVNVPLAGAALILPF